MNRRYEKRYINIKEKPKWLLKLGDRVRISKTRRYFKKGYLPNWSDKLFTVAVRHPTDPPTYEIDDYDKERVKEKFHELELQKVAKVDDVYKVETVLKTRKRNGRKEYFVSGSFIPTSSIPGYLI